MKVLTDNQYYGQIANVIREQNGTNNTYKPPQMVNALKNLFYEEVEGVPPISFNGIGEDLLDYRIDGTSGGVGDRTENLFNKNNVVKDILQDAGQYVSGIGCVMFVIDVRNVSVISFQTTVGTERCRSSFSVEYPAIGVPYIINGQNTFINSDGQRNKITRSVPKGANYLGVQVFRNSDNYDEEVINNAINSFIACSGTAIGAYEPYGYKIPVTCGGTTTNIYLDEPLEENESISMSDKGISIPTINGTNILTVDTTVQPRKVYVKLRKESSHEAQIRQLYESVNAELTQYKAQYGELGGE